MVALSRESAVFIKFTHNADREKSPWAEESIIPVNRLLSDNPAREYNVPVGKATIIICDWFGNEYFTQSATVKPDALKRFIDRVAVEVERSDKALQRTLDYANRFYEKQDYRKTVRKLMDNFKTGVYGLPAQEASVKLYREIVEIGRDKLNKLVEAGDTDGIRALAREFGDTELKKEAEDALKKPVTQTEKE